MLCDRTYIIKDQQAKAEGPRFRTGGSHDEYVDDIGMISGQRPKTSGILQVVTNGIPVVRGYAPWQALLEDMNSGEICGGSVLNTQYILTAAHCIESFKKSEATNYRFPRNILGKFESWKFSNISNIKVLF